MSAYNLPDYKAKYFEYNELDKIYGQPNIESIVKLYKQVKRNAQSVPTTLGGGQLGYLALVIPPATYNAIGTAAPFVRPVDPGPFVPSPPTGVATRAGGGPTQLTAADITTQKIAYDERKRLFNEAQAVESALRSQIISAIDSVYMQPLRDRVTDMITQSIPDIFTFLQNTYGKITTSQLKNKETEVEDQIYDPATSVDTVFNKVDALQDLCILTANDKTDTQLRNMAYLIFQKSGIFMESLKKWNQKPVADKTYDNFKLFMRQEYHDLQEVGGLTVNDGMRHQANILREIKDHQQNVANEIKEELTANFLQSLQAYHMPTGQENIHPYMEYLASNGISQNELLPPEASMNAAIQQQDPVVQQLLQQMSMMQNQIANLTLTAKAGGNKRQIQNGDLNPKTGKPWRRYCWTHGCCTHWGRLCPQKKAGHKDDATFRNRMGGSNENCL